MSLEAESWERMGFRKDASPIELMISWFTFGAGREPTKRRLVPKRRRKRAGGMKRRVLILRGFSLPAYLTHYRPKEATSTTHYRLVTNTSNPI